VTGKTITHETDVLVIGSGAGGLSAAVTAAHMGLKVTVAERAAVLGGATAWSGGWMWVPRNPLAVSAGIVEDQSAPRAYLQAVLGNRFDAARIDAFLDTAPQMVSFFEDNTALQFEAGNGICDIYGDLPGAGTGGRSVIAAPFDARDLGKLNALLRKTMPETAFIGMPIMAGADLAAFLTATRKLSSLVHVTKRFVRHLRDLAFHQRAMQLVNGNALVARLIRSGEDFGVKWLTSSPVLRLVTERGRVTGATLMTGEGERAIRARQAVVLATGGFPHNKERRAETFPNTPGGKAHWSVATPEADGAGLQLALEVGGVFDASGAAAGAWCPVSLVPNRDGSFGHFPHIIERAKPGIIGVRADGRRFVNEANGYHDYVSALFAATPEGEEVASWLICDHRFQRRYGLGIARPSPIPLAKWLRNGYLLRARTIEDLAEQCGIDSAGLQATIAAYNRHAAHGEDPEFGRGSTPYNRSQGDKAVAPNPNVLPVGNAPYYAVKVLPGSFGTFAGIKADAKARVLDANANPIPGLFVAGSDMASILGGHYPAGGINLGPAMTFGYIAACEISRLAEGASR
jgi:succinate dehydrogenase/fumarate reductase flavoprotein subunit